MIPAALPARLATRFVTLAERLAPSSASNRLEQGQRKLLAAISAAEPATLNQIAEAVGRGAPAVSRSVDALVRAGLVERQPDPDNRRRLALRLTSEGRARLDAAPEGNRGLQQKFARIAQSELRAVERAIEILERLPG
jgi:DNA-binding MarR family transcriptional regulator